MIASSRVRLEKTPAAMVFGMPRIVQSVSRKEANPRGTSVSPVSPEKPLDVSDNCSDDDLADITAYSAQNAWPVVSS